jgi:hypothetical protein
MAHLLGKHRRTKVVWQRYTVMNSNLAFVRGRDLSSGAFSWFCLARFLPYQHDLLLLLSNRRAAIGTRLNA